MYKMRQQLDGFSLKMIAIAAMTIDHIAVIFFPEALWMRVIGRLTMPIMAFLIAESYCHTRSPRHYLYRLLTFATVAQVPFMLAFGTYTLNVLFTLATAVSVLMVENSQIKKPMKLLLTFGLLLFSLLCDWALFGVLFVWVFFKFRNDFRRQIAAFAMVVAAELIVLALNANDYTFFVEAGVFLALPFLSLYNGKRGFDMRYLFYIFYPAHLALFALLHWLIGR